MVFIGTPNNPTGQLVAPQVLQDAAKDHAERIFVIDEAFIDFCIDAEDRTLINRGLPENMIVVKSLTKFFAIPGLRLGMACGHPNTIDRINSVRLPWTVNALAQSLAVKLYENRDYIETSRKRIDALRLRFVQSLNELPGLTVYGSQANFVLVRLPDRCRAPRLQGELLKQGILIRTCEDFEGLGSAYCRLAVRPEHEMDELLEAMSAVFDNRHPVVSCRDKRCTPAIMIVGTTSNAGKSIIATALCRLLARRGFIVAPFKAQNMALNSYVTAEGGEMGRAQVTQAYAAGVRPHTDMNPVLLKPLGEDGSQVVVNGQAIGNFKAREYYAMKNRMRNTAREAYDRLAERHEVIVLEGAGSPAEINLMDKDFVNMDMAAYAGASTILVADIDRGGVFASIFGTVNLIPGRYRHLLKGIIINKFRGDESLLKSGIKDIQAMTGIPVLGVLPFIKDIGIEDEDSQGLESRTSEDNALLDIVIVRLQRISNFTDFHTLERTPLVRVRYVGNPAFIGSPDLIILPGTKNTRGDLRYLQESGWSELLRDAAENGIPLFGICGGYQMLGKSVDDPDGVEGEPGSEPGLALLPLTTVLKSKKELAQVRGITATLPFASPGTPFIGYEIHAGETLADKDHAAPLVVQYRNSNPVEEPSGCVSESGMVFGCYIHGLFDVADLRHQLVDWLCGRKGITTPSRMMNAETDMDPYGLLADLLAKHVDVNAIYDLVGLSAGAGLQRVQNRERT